MWGLEFLFSLTLSSYSFCVFIFTWGLDCRGRRVGERVYQFVRMIFYILMTRFLSMIFLVNLGVVICDRGLENSKSIHNDF